MKERRANKRRKRDKENRVSEATSAAAADTFLKAAFPMCQAILRSHEDAAYVKMLERLQKGIFLKISLLCVVERFSQKNISQTKDT